MSLARRLLSRTLTPPGTFKASGGRWGTALISLGLVPCILACTPPADLEEWTVELVFDLAIGAEPVTPETAFQRPSEIGFDGAENVYILDSGNHRVQVFDRRGSYIRTFGEAGDGPGQLNEPQGMHVAADGRVWLADAGNRRLQRFAADGEPLDPTALDFIPTGLVVTDQRIFMQRLPQGNLLLGPSPAPVLRIFDHAGSPVGGVVAAESADSGLLYMLENLYAMSPAPDGGVALAHMHFSSLIRLIDAHGDDAGEIPVLYKAGAWAPLGRRPAELNEASLERVARTASRLAWDAHRELFWVLAGNVDQTADGEWIRGVEAYRYAADGSYQGSAMLPQRATSLACGPDGRVWTIDLEGVVRAFRVTDPEIADSADVGFLPAPRRGISAR